MTYHFVAIIIILIKLSLKDDLEGGGLTASLYRGLKGRNMVHSLKKG